MFIRREAVEEKTVFVTCLILLGRTAFSQCVLVLAWAQRLLSSTQDISVNFDSAHHQRLLCL